MKPMGHEATVDGEVYVLVDCSLLRKLNPDKGPCQLCGVPSGCECVDCIIDGPEIGVYVRKLEE